MSKTEIRRLSGSIDPTKFQDAKEFLSAVYLELKARIPQYSYTRFTEDMGFGACNAMYLIIHGRRPLTLKGAEKLVSALGLTGVGRQYFLQLVKSQRADGASERETVFDRLVALKAKSLPKALDRRQLEFYNDWYNAAILELLSLEQASDDPDWLSSHLMPTVAPLKVKKSLGLLKKLGHLVFDKQRGRLVPSNQELSTGSEVLGLAVIRYHQQMIGLAKGALMDIAPMERDISAVTIGVPAERIDELKEKIRTFRRELLDFSQSCADTDQIVQLNIQLFPIARISGGKRHDD